jgi:thiamine-monophosphate kinase
MNFSEERIIEMLKESNLPNGVLGIGDDCAVIPNNANNSWLISTDALVEDVHFSISTISAEDLGSKAISVNISDVAAMGGTPKFVFISCAIPDHLDNVFMKRFISGIKEQTKKHNIHLLGGDTTASKSKFFISVTIIGQANNNKIKYRSTAKIGDNICITGMPGASAAGLELTKNIQSLICEDDKYLINKHFAPHIYLQESQYLANFNSVHAMIDCSDGLNKDISRICTQSNCSININVDMIPIDDRLQRICAKNNWDLYKFLLTGGEDYYLIFTIDSKDFANIHAQYFKKFDKNFHCIGNVVAKGNEEISYFKYGAKYTNIYQDFKHF